MKENFTYSKPIKVNRLPENPDQEEHSEVVPLGRFPKWLHRKIPKGKELANTHKILDSYGLNTVCSEAKCPNRQECYTKKTATFLACGSACTRACGFCDIDFAKNPLPLDPKEPEKIAQCVRDLGLKHVVITMVARDDLEDKGAGHIVHIIEQIRLEHPDCTVEVLTSDFSGKNEAIDAVCLAKPDIFNHNIETVKRLSSRVRHKATYERTLQVLERVREAKGATFIKSGIMVGLGETKEEVFETIQDLKDTGCDIITIGQYLQASQKKLKVSRFVTPEEFKEYETYGNKIGVQHIYSGPFVRSSYNAKAVLEKTMEATHA